MSLLSHGVDGLRVSRDGLTLDVELGGRCLVLSAGEAMSFAAAMLRMADEILHPAPVETVAAPAEHKPRKSLAARIYELQEACDADVGRLERTGAEKEYLERLDAVYGALHRCLRHIAIDINRIDRAAAEAPVVRPAKPVGPPNIEIVAGDPPTREEFLGGTERMPGGAA